MRTWAAAAVLLSWTACGRAPEPPADPSPDAPPRDDDAPDDEASLAARRADQQAYYERIKAGPPSWGRWFPDPRDPSVALREPVLTFRDPPSQPPPSDAPDVVLVTIDTWRADRLALYGSPRAATSRRLAERLADAVVFERAYAPAPWTLPTMASLASGLYPSAHGAVRQEGRLCEEAETLAEALWATGRRTGFSGSNSYFEAEDVGLQQGFEFFWGRGHEDAARVLEYADHFLTGVPGEPVFLHVHLFEPHCPYDPHPDALAAVRAAPFGLPGRPGDPPPPDFARVFDDIGGCHLVPPPPLGREDRFYATWKSSEDRQDWYDHYDGELMETDAALSDLFDLLEKHDRFERSWIVVTADHGEEFGEHGRVGHGKSVYAETTRVPLLIRPPRDPAAPREGARLRTPVSLVDLPPTLLRALGATPPGSWQGRDLGPAVAARSEPARRPVFAESDYEGVAARLVVGETHTMHLSPAGQAVFADADLAHRHDLAKDPARSSEAAAAAAALAAHDAAWRAIEAGRVCAVGQAVEHDAERLERLRALGYTGGEAPSPTPSE